jgi:hypothetical protein
MLLIYVDEVTERLTYTLDFIFRDRGIDFQLSNDPIYFQEFAGTKLNYSNRFFEQSVKLSPATVLFDEAIFPYSVDTAEFAGEPCLSFDNVTDPLASIFYVLSRMEEYTDGKRDMHDRFAASQSILYRHGWLQHAMCDRWSMAFIRFLDQQLHTELNPFPIEVRIIPSFDIDNTFAFQWKAGWKRWAGQLRDWLRGDTERLERRKQVEAKTSKDPYDTYDYIREIAQRGFEVRLFWLLGDYAKYDKNISSLDARHQELIRKMAETTSIGLHPSYKSNSSTYYLSREKTRIDAILREPVTASRQHFLKLTIPMTYQNLITQGFTDDYTMGYADETGFRAGTARAFRFFDLARNLQTEYMIHPFVYMDGTLNEYKKYTTAESKSVVLALYREVAQMGGDFICIWHNETIGSFGKWKGWRQVLDFTLKLKDGH